MYSKGSTKKIKYKELKGKKEMKVTKLIREYVESSVREMYAPKIDACGADYKKKMDEVNKTLAKMTEEFNNTAKEMIKKNGLSINIRYGTEEESRIISYTTSFGNKEYAPIYEKRRKLTVERDEKIKEVLLTLELGGTKAELDEMLKKIKEEVVG